MAPPAAPLAQGALFAGFIVERLLRSDSSGQVYLVRHPSLPRHEVLRILPAEVASDDGFRARFHRDADLAATLSHPDIVSVQRHGEFRGRLWISMDYVEGTDLAHLMRTRYPTGMPATDVVSITTVVADALDYAHHQGAIHGGVTPATILVGPSNDRGTSPILLTDFGIARQANHTDQYALAATAYYLLTGTRLDERAPAPLPGELRAELSTFDWVFATAFAEDSDRRFSSCGDFALALAGGLLRSAPAEIRYPPVAAPTPTADQATPPHRRQSRRIKALLVVLAVLALIGGGTTYGMHRMHVAEVARQLAADRENARLAGQHYLEALAGGDAATALSLAAQPPGDTRFLTNDVLRAQLAAMPISDISVTAEPGGSNDAETLLLSAKFGAIPSKTAMQARKIDGQWKLDAVAVPLSIGTDPAAKTPRIVTLFGVATAGGSPVPVFPGVPQISSGNQYVDLTADVKPLLLEALTDPAQRPAIVPNVTLNDAGRTAALQAIERFQESCFTGGPPSYKCCPTGNCSPPPAQNQGIDGDTIRIVDRLWVGEMTYALDPATMLVTVNGTIRYDGEAQVWGTVRSITFGVAAKDSFVDLLMSPPEKIAGPR